MFCLQSGKGRAQAVKGRENGMFFMIGVTQGRKDFDFHQLVVCGLCGAYGRYQVFMTYSVLSLFLLPVWKWNRQYFVRTSCCNTLYRLDEEIGRRIARGEQVQIQPQHLQRVSPAGARMRHCPNCGFTTAENFTYCPQCGGRLE